MRIRLNLLLDNCLLKKLLAQLLDKLVVQIGKAILLDNDVVRGFALTETRDAVLTGHFAGGLAQFALDAFLIYLDRDR